jgi:cell wall-associated NlpC family hydrolase
MKLIACTLPLLAGVPSVLSAQIRVGSTLGPIAVVATLGGRGVTVRATPRGSRHLPAARLPRATSASAARVLATADRYLGTRYRYGGKTPAAGFDCSGFVQYVFGRNGVNLLALLASKPL